MIIWQEYKSYHNSLFLVSPWGNLTLVQLTDNIYIFHNYNKKYCRPS
ncbi:conserved hypothetical protein [Xenorhabdus bovienii str. kraussei Quebec]|uniref:Uncharacterized protein n=1 Tax=Xenorhabdus bovienii str. kraussei Quebec TaxID=1398203 RepID=A0A077PNB4_XENBV|nr:conserved hypothetical protein [Xenorhabdus bovienii str. kraussei Quebec]